MLESPWDFPLCTRGMWTQFPCSPHSDVIEPPPQFGKKPLVWEEDLELYSKFLNQKVRKWLRPA